MESVTLGYAKRPELLEGNLENNQSLEVKKGDTLKIYKYNEATVNGVHAYDSIETCKVLAIRKSKDGRRVKIQNLDLNYECTLLIDKSQCKIEIIKEVPAVEEINIVETLKNETENIIQATKTQEPQEPQEALQSINNQLDKVTNTINQNINDESIRLQLRDVENDLKWHYSSLDNLRYK